MNPQQVVDRIIALVSASYDAEAIAFWRQLDAATVAQMDGQQLADALAYLRTATEYAVIPESARERVTIA